MRALTVGMVTPNAVVVGLLVLSVLSASSAVAGGVVGNGKRISCTEGALDAALAGGGSVTFNCGARPFKLTVTTPKTIAADTSLDGGGRLKLSGGGKVQIFRVNEGVTLSLSNATFSGGSTAFGISLGGAIENYGTVIVTNSTCSRNRGYLGGAIANYGALTVTNCTFFGNSAEQGGAISNYGALAVTGSTFSRNGSTGFGGGGAISSYDSMLAPTVTITNSMFSRNRASGSGGGGAINSDTPLTVTDTTFSHNSALRGSGGAISNGGDAGGTLTVTNCTFFRNRATGNTDDIDGLGGAIANGATLTVTNSTFSRNSAVRGGAIFSSGDATLESTTVANSSRGANCVGTITDGGHNLRWPMSDTSCVGNFGAPSLTALEDDATPTPTLETPTVAPATPTPHYKADAEAYVLTTDGGQTILTQKQPTAMRRPFSLIKLMTALVAMDYARAVSVCSEDAARPCLSDDECAGAGTCLSVLDGTHPKGLVKVTTHIPGGTYFTALPDTLTLREALFCMLLQSANECAGAIVTYVTGDPVTTINQVKTVRSFILPMSEGGAGICKDKTDVSCRSDGDCLAAAAAGPCLPMNMVDKARSLGMNICLRTNGTTCINVGSCPKVLGTGCNILASPHGYEYGSRVTAQDWTKVAWAALTDPVIADIAKTAVHTLVYNGHVADAIVSKLAKTINNHWIDPTCTKLGNCGYRCQPGGPCGAIGLKNGHRSVANKALAATCPAENGKTVVFTELVEQSWHGPAIFDAAFDQLYGAGNWTCP